MLSWSDSEKRKYYLLSHESRQKLKNHLLQPLHIPFALFTQTPLSSSGPVDCRRGQLLLTESSIELLGGEVQEIAISNSLAGQLSTKLGLPMTQGKNLIFTLIFVAWKATDVQATDWASYHDQKNNTEYSIVNNLKALFLQGDSHLQYLDL